MSAALTRYKHAWDRWTNLLALHIYVQAATKSRADETKARLKVAKQRVLDLGEQVTLERGAR